MNIYEKSLLLTVFNATMIARSLGRVLPVNERDLSIKSYKKLTFEEMEKLVNKMDNGTLQRRDIHKSLDRIKAALPRISFGQAQKGLNVLLKVHWFLYHRDETIAEELDCPLDSKVLRSLNSSVALSTLERDTYMDKQNQILSASQLRGQRRIDYDILWDEQHLRDEGLL